MLVPTIATVTKEVDAPIKPIHSAPAQLDPWMLLVSLGTAVFGLGKLYLDRESKRFDALLTTMQSTHDRQVQAMQTALDNQGKTIDKLLDQRKSRP